jgi:hypothetical protein
LASGSATTGSSKRCGAGGVKVLVPLLELKSEIDALLFKKGDSSTELVDVVGRPETGLAPHLLGQRFGEPLLELVNLGGQTDASVLCVEQIRL